MIPCTHIEQGTLLIASPEVDTGFFARTVLLVCEHNPVGSFGLVVNKPLDVDLPEEVANLKQAANPRIAIRSGGPVHTNQMMLLHTSDQAENQALKVCENVYLGGNLTFLQTALNDPSGPWVSLYFGYTGWGAGQLEREFLDGQWFICPSSQHALFEVPSDKLWQVLLREMGGKYATLSMIPVDLSLN